LESHPKLEELRFEDPLGNERNRFFGAKGWKLMFLKDLVYHSCGKLDPSRPLVVLLKNVFYNFTIFHSIYIQELWNIL